MQDCRRVTAFQAALKSVKWRQSTETLVLKRQKKEKSRAKEASVSKERLSGNQPRSRPINMFIPYQEGGTFKTFA